MTDNPYEAPEARLDDAPVMDADGERRARLRHGKSTGLRYGIAFCVPFLALLAWVCVNAFRDGRVDHVLRLLLMLLPLAVLAAIGAWWGAHATGKRAWGLVLASLLQGLLLLVVFIAAGEMLFFLDVGRWAPFQGDDWWMVPLLGAFLAALCLALGLAIRHRLRRAA